MSSLVNNILLQLTVAYFFLVTIKRDFWLFALFSCNVLVVHDLMLLVVKQKANYVIISVNCYKLLQFHAQGHKFSFIFSLLDPVEMLIFLLLHVITLICWVFCVFWVWPTWSSFILLLKKSKWSWLKINLTISKCSL